MLNLDIVRSELIDIARDAIVPIVMVVINSNNDDIKYVKECKGMAKISSYDYDDVGSGGADNGCVGTNYL